MTMQNRFQYSVRGLLKLSLGQVYSISVICPTPLTDWNRVDLSLCQNNMTTIPYVLIRTEAQRANFFLHSLHCIASKFKNNLVEY